MPGEVLHLACHLIIGDHSLDELSNIPQHYLKEIEHFFRVYKDLEGTHTETRGFEGATAARAAVTRAMVAYRERFDAGR